MSWGAVAVGGASLVGGMMGGKGGGGSVSTAGLEQATRESTALQRDIYDKNVELAKPWYDTGVTAMGRLSDLLGLEGGSMRSREQIYQDLLPQYTTQGAPTGLIDIGGNTFGTEQFLDRDLSFDDLIMSDTGALGLTPQELSNLRNMRVNLQSQYGQSNDLQAALDAVGGIRALTPVGGQDVTDFEGLNIAVDEALAGQELPDDFGSLTERFDLTKFEEDPGYQYRQQEAQKALERSMAAQGVTLGGGGFGNINPQVAKALEAQSQGLAAQEYGDAYSRYTQDQLNQYGMLSGMAGYGTTGLGNITGAGSQYATNVGNLTTGLAQAQTQADLAGASQASMFEQLLPVAGQLGAAYLMKSDRSLKENIEKVGTENGHNLYEFNYKGEEERYVGVMAQEVQEIEPEAVMVMPNGYLGVNYDMIGLEMRLV